MAENSSKEKRFLSWTCVVYPNESLPDNWQELLGELMIPWVISPLHDKDVNEDGTPKKAHRHLLLSFRSVKSYTQVKEITDKLNAPAPQPCRDTRGMVRYFLHLDNPSKAQYLREDIICGGGFDLDDALKLSKSETSHILKELRTRIYERSIKEFAHLDMWVLKYHPEWDEVVRTNSNYLNNIIKSIRNARLVDIETGEEIG